MIRCWACTRHAPPRTPEQPNAITHQARIAGTRPQSMGANIAALEAGLVTGRANPDDGRETILSLTPAREDWIRAGRAPVGLAA
jgi:DNA-binding MarR family transcriptional regulator